MAATELRDVGELDKALAVDQHRNEPTPDGTAIPPRGSSSESGSVPTSPPLQWVAGAIGPQLGLSLVRSIVIMVLGQAAGRG